MASPAIAMAPTPRPMKILSMILYRLVATLAMMAGTEYCISRCDMELVPSSIGDDAGAGVEGAVLEFEVEVLLAIGDEGIHKFTNFATNKVRRQNKFL